MEMYQKVTMPALHGSAPKGLAMIINRPKGPSKPIKFKSFKEAMAYLKEKEEDEG